MISQHCVYRLYDAAGALVYIGVTGAIERRLSQHRRVAPWWPKVASVDVEHFGTREEAGRAEGVAIERELPLWNKAGLRQHSKRCGCLRCERRRELPTQPGLFVARSQR